ncbi:MAG: hypothetical protein VKK62_07475 [Synechococcaceae cyanobacterium]|nr:hypothetical protein [Synechococcaceae cyanobacterium]
MPVAFLFALSGGPGETLTPASLAPWGPAGWLPGPADLQAAITGAWQFDPAAYRNGQGAIGVVIALLAGLSQSVGQAFILFVNRVRPLRFLISLLLEAILFAFGFLLWALTTWLVARLLFGLAPPLPAVIRALGIAHAPQLLAFLGALPYLGSPWLTLLSLWTAVGFVVGLGAVTDLPPWSALACLIGGWLAMHLLQRSAGQPVSQAGVWLLQRAAGVELERDGRRLAALADGTVPPPPSRRS